MAKKKRQLTPKERLEEQKANAAPAEDEAEVETEEDLAEEETEVDETEGAEADDEAVEGEPGEMEEEDGPSPDAEGDQQAMEAATLLQFLMQEDEAMKQEEAAAQLAADEQAQADAIAQMIPAEERIKKEDVREATRILKEYKAGKSRLESRVVDNEQWYKLRHWGQIDPDNKNNDPRPTSAWLFNSIANKHADAMDNFPMPNVLPREESDKHDSQVLSSILPVILEQNEFEQLYSDVWWYKLKTGTGVYGVFWNPRRQNGLGDIDIKQLDLLNLFWEPGIKDIQDSRHLFNVELIDNDLLKEQYPFLEDELGSSTVEIKQYVFDNSIDTTKKSAVVDWYYKKQNGAMEQLHYVKFVNDHVLYASENDAQYQDVGFYNHGKYPIVFDTLFSEEGTPAGFGMVDIMKDPQMYIDKLYQVILQSALMSSRKRFFIRDEGAVNEEEFADWSKTFVHTAGSSLGEDSIREIQVSPMSGIYMGILNGKIEEIKETSGNRDFSQGGTTGGVTAASAIAALQEAGSKLSRDMIKASYRAFTKINYLIIELIRQFYDEPREFRIIGEQGKPEFTQFDNRGIKPREASNEFGVELGARVPIFDIKVNSQRSNPFSRISQNEMAKEFYGMGFFNPQMSDQALVCMDMMEFEGKDTVVERISQNGTMQKQLMEMQQQMMQMQMMLQQQQAMLEGGEEGEGEKEDAPASAAEKGKSEGKGGGAQARPSGKKSKVQTDSLGKAVDVSNDARMTRARENAASQAAVDK